MPSLLVMKTLPLLGERYRLGPIVGTGGMGSVHRAWDERFDREVAVKVVRAGADAVEQERLRREAQYLARLDHPSLVAVYDAGADRTSTGETVWFAMELVHGPDLRRVLADRGRLSTADAARVLEGAAGALQVLHAAGVVHRDLKPANVLLTADPDAGRWDVKLADLGIAQLMRAEQLLTATGQVVGTAAYLSPEQVSGGRIGPPCDVYALGLLAIEALTGRVPFPGGVAESVTARLVRDPEMPAAAGREWCRLLTAMTARDPEDRPDARAVAERLRALPRSAEPLPDEARATDVLPASVLRPGTPVEDLPTEAIEPGVTRPLAQRPVLGPPTSWTPALRPRRAPLRRRRALLAAGALTAALGLAGGGAALLGGGGPPASAETAPSSSAPAVQRHSPAPTPTPSRTPSAAPSVAPSRTASAAAPAPAAPAVQAPAVKTSDRHGAARGRDRAQREVERGLRRLEDRLRDRLRH